jgi:hypothetical protein
MERTTAHEAWTGLSPEERVRACLEMICDGTTATAEDIQGLGEGAIQEIDDDQPAAPLGAAYRCFLQRAGAGAGRFLQGSDVFHPDVIGLRAAAQELMAGTGLALEATDRVILMHQGYQFDFLRGHDEDPEVWSYSDGSTPHRHHTHFTEWLRANAEEQTRAWVQLAQWGS